MGTERCPNAMLSLIGFAYDFGEHEAGYSTPQLQS
jgi:hypothetical protein